MRCTILALLSLGAAVWSQTGPKPFFETASIKITDPKGGGGHSHENDDPGMLRGSMTLKTFIMTAYNLQPYQVAGGPNWIDSSTYEIVARLEHPEAAAAKGFELPLHVALQSLLTERFQLKFHRETKDLPAFAMTVAKSGFKLKESTARTGCGTDSSPGPGRTVNARCIDMESVRRLLGRQLDRPVFDRTNIHGRYDFTLQWMPDNLRDTVSTDQPALPSLFTALEEQLGIKIEAIKAPVEVLIVESAERPSEN